MPTANAHDEVLGPVSWDKERSWWRFEVGPIGGSIIPEDSRVPLAGVQLETVRACVAWIRGNEPPSGSSSRSRRSTGGGTAGTKRRSTRSPPLRDSERQYGWVASTSTKTVRPACATRTAGCLPGTAVGHGRAGWHLRGWAGAVPVRPDPLNRLPFPAANLFSSEDGFGASISKSRNTT